MKHNHRSKIIDLLAQQLELLVKVQHLVNNKKAVGLLLTDIVQISRQTLTLLEKKKISLRFVRSFLPVLIELGRVIIGRWLNRYQLRRSRHLLIENIYEINGTIYKASTY